MPISLHERQAYRADEKQRHTLLTEEEKSKLIHAHLPPVNDPAPSRQNTNSQRRGPRLGLRRFVKAQVHVLVFVLLHGLFSLYIRLRQTVHLISYQVSSVLYYHHGTPQYIRRDVEGLSRKPSHLSVILRAERSHRVKADLDRLVDEAAEIATWCACAEIPMLSVYEKTGILKQNMPRVYEATVHKLAFYFGGQHPTISVTSPHQDEISSSTMNSPQGHLRLHLISAQDGRDSMTDLTRTLAEMSQRGKLSPNDISIELIDAELSEGIMPEPELLILFSPYVDLDGYPPWQIRLTEIFCLQDNEAFGYQVFLKAIRNFAGAQFRRGK